MAEADESDGSFLQLSPTIAVVTNIDADHLDFYSGIEEIKDTFVEFINKIPFYGLAVLCLDNGNVADIIPLVKKRFTTYGLSRPRPTFGQAISRVARKFPHALWRIIKESCWGRSPSRCRARTMC